MRRMLNVIYLVGRSSLIAASVAQLQISFFCIHKSNLFKETVVPSPVFSRVCFKNDYFGIFLLAVFCLVRWNCCWSSYSGWISFNVARFVVLVFMMLFSMFVCLLYWCLYWSFGVWWCLCYELDFLLDSCYWVVGLDYCFDCWVLSVFSLLYICFRCLRFWFFLVWATRCHTIWHRAWGWTCLGFRL